MCSLCRPGPVSALSWEEVNIQFHELCPNVLAVIDLILTMSPTSVECERGFSTMKLIKSDWRNRLNNTKLNDLMRIILQCPEIGEFDPEPAVDLWYTTAMRRRRLEDVPQQEKSEAESESDDDYDTLHRAIGILRELNANKGLE